MINGFHVIRGQNPHFAVRYPAPPVGICIVDYVDGITLSELQHLGAVGVPFEVIQGAIWYVFEIGHVWFLHVKIYGTRY